MRPAYTNTLGPSDWPHLLQWKRPPILVERQFPDSPIPLGIPGINIKADAHLNTVLHHDERDFLHGGGKPTAAAPTDQYLDFSIPAIHVGIHGLLAANSIVGFHINVPE